MDLFHSVEDCSSCCLWYCEDVIGTKSSLPQAESWRSPQWSNVGCNSKVKPLSLRDLDVSRSDVLCTAGPQLGLLLYCKHWTREATEVKMAWVSGWFRWRHCCWLQVSTALTDCSDPESIIRMWLGHYPFPDPYRYTSFLGVVAMLTLWGSTHH
jgi:hypothetical protein